jgi:hypothetical protein
MSIKLYRRTIIFDFGLSVFLLALGAGCDEIAHEEGKRKEETPSRARPSRDKTNIDTPDFKSASFNKEAVGTGEEKASACDVDPLELARPVYTAFRHS